MFQGKEAEKFQTEIDEMELERKKDQEDQTFYGPEKQVLTVRCLSMRLANVVKVLADTSCALEIHGAGTWQHI